MARQHYLVLDAASLAGLRDPHRDFALDVLVGLSERPKRLPSRYFYDDTGSRIFQEIMALPEYYLTRCEEEILQRNAAAILASFGARRLNLVDLGAGDGSKTVWLLEQLLGRVELRYVPIDISEAAIQSCIEVVGRRLPQLEIEGLVADYSEGLQWLASQDPARHNLCLFLGSNLGNFDKPKARAFLRRLWYSLHPGDCLLVGFDLKKEIDVLLDAYADAQGVTARFNLNLLTRINRELGGNFDLDKFRHFGTYDVFSGAMQSYLVSHERQTVHVEALRNSFVFEEREPIHTEYSYKYLTSDVDALALATGYVVEARYYDPQRYFVDALLRVEKQ